MLSNSDLSYILTHCLFFKNWVKLIVVDRSFLILKIIVLLHIYFKTSIENTNKNGRIDILSEGLFLSDYQGYN